MAAKEDPQGGLFDREVFDQELEEACRIALDEDNKEIVKAVRKAKQTIKKKAGQLEISADERVRVGDFILEGNSMHRETVEIPAWDSVTAKVSRMP